MRYRFRKSIPNELSAQVLETLDKNIRARCEAAKTFESTACA